jgi:DNA-binding PadR family transcriptional regulator
MVKFEHILLGLFAQRPWSGYDLKKWLSEGGKFFRSNADQSQIYRLLARMETSGWISHTVDPREKRPDAKVYTLTEQGRAELLEWARSPYAPPARFQDPDFLVRFVFGGIVDPVGLRALLETELAARKEQVVRHRSRDRTPQFTGAIAEVDTDRARLLLELSHIRGMSEIDNWITWLEEMLVTLDAARVIPPAPAPSAAPVPSPSPSA